MKLFQRFTIGNLLLWVTMLTVTQMRAENMSVHFPDIALQPGETAEMVVSYDTDYQNICGFQIEFELPSGIHLTDAKLAGNYLCPENFFGFNPDREGTVVIMNGLYYSSTTLPSGHQDFLVLTFHADVDAVERTYDIDTELIEFSHWGRDKADLYDNQTFHIIVGTPAPAKSGDVNGDGEVDINDVMSTVKHILGVFNTTFNSVAADIDGDGEIGISDVMKIVEIILYGNYIPNLELSTTAVEMTSGTVTVEIVSGSGNYKVTSSAPDMVEATLDGNKVVITSKVLGTMEVTPGGGQAGAPRRAPVIHNAVVTVTDLVTKQTRDIGVTIIEINLGCPDNNHPHMIDLGLPSGTKWACCNVGADNPEDYGGYYAWGETAEKDNYTVWNYEHYGDPNDQPIVEEGPFDAIGNGSYYTKGNNGYYVKGKDANYIKGNNGPLRDEVLPAYDVQEGWRDLGESISGTEFDAATANWGNLWQMPSEVQFEEMLNNCTCESMTINGHPGLLCTGANGNSIFFPFAGWIEYINSNGKDEYGCYWTGNNFYADEWMLDWDEETGEYFHTWGDFSSYYYLYEDGGNMDDCMPRWGGLPVRPVGKSSSTWLSPATPWR